MQLPAWRYSVFGLSKSLEITMDRFMDRANLYLSMDVNENGTNAQRRRKTGCDRECAFQVLLLARHPHMLWLSHAILILRIWRLYRVCLQRFGCGRMV